MAENISQQEASQGRILVTPTQTNLDDLTDIVEEAWVERDNATLELLHALSLLLVKQITEIFPNARLVVVREDTSHLPAHGHLDDVLDQDGISLLSHQEDPHSWPISIDETAWEIYYVASQYFSQDEDSVRRFRIGLPDPA